MSKTTYTASDKEREMDFIIQFAKTRDFFFESNREQLRCLWIAYCLHNNYSPDTWSYDQNLYPVWEEMEKNPSCPWTNDDEEGTDGFTLFDLYMGDPLC